jgi:hypothetical protein
MSLFLFLPFFACHFDRLQGALRKPRRGGNIETGIAPVGVPEKGKKHGISYIESPMITPSALAGFQWNAPEMGHVSNLKRLWGNSKQPGTDFIIGERCTAPEERNQPLADGVYFLLFRNPTNQRKCQASFKPSRRFKFYFIPPCPPGVLFFSGGGIFKSGFEKGKRRT